MTHDIEVLQLVLGPLGANCFIVAGDGVGLLVDPGDEPEQVVAVFDELGIPPAAILLTHGHFDHFGAVGPLARRYDAPVYIGKDDAPEIAAPAQGMMWGVDVQGVDGAVALDGEQEIELALPVLAIPTPGHSPGSYTFVCGRELFAGDLIFLGSVGRTDLPGGSSEELLNSIAGLVRRFPSDTVVHTGHGPDTSLGRELALNPFLSPLRYDPHHRW